MNDVSKSLLSLSSASNAFFKNWVKGSTGRTSELIPAVSLPVNLALSFAAVFSLRTVISYAFTRKGEAKSRCVILNEIAEVLDKWELICIREVCTCCQEGVCVLEGDEAELARLVGGPQLAVLSRLWNTNWNRRLREKPVFFNGTLSQTISTDFKVREYISLSLASRGILTLPADQALLERLDFIIQYGIFRRLCLMEEARCLREMSRDGAVTETEGELSDFNNNNNNNTSLWGGGRGRGGRGRERREIWRVCGKPSWLIPHGYQDGRKQRFFCLPLSYLPVESIMTHSADWLYSDDMEKLRTIWRKSCRNSLRQSCRAVENMILREWVSDDDIESNRNAFAKYRYLAAHTVVSFWFHRYALRMIGYQKRMMERGARQFYQSRLYHGNPWGQSEAVTVALADRPAPPSSSKDGLPLGAGQLSTEKKLEQQKLQQEMADRNRRVRKLLLLEGACMCMITALECTATRMVSQLTMIAASAVRGGPSSTTPTTTTSGASMLRTITSNILLSSLTGVGSVIVRQVKKRVTDQLGDILTKEVEEHFANLLISSDHAFLDRFFAAKTDTMKRGWRGSREMSAKNLMRRTAGSGNMLIGKFDNVVRRWATAIFLIALSTYRRDLTALCIASTYLIPGTEDLHAKASVYFGFSQSFKARPILEEKSLPQEPRYGLSLLVQVLSERMVPDQRLRRLPQITDQNAAAGADRKTIVPTLASFQPVSPERYVRRYKKRFSRTLKSFLPSFLKSGDDDPCEGGRRCNRRGNHEVVIDSPAVGGVVLRGTQHPALSFIACSGVWKMEKVVGSAKSLVDMTPVQRQLQFERAQCVELLYSWLEAYKLERGQSSLYFLRAPLSPMQENISYLLKSAVQPAVRRMSKLVMSDNLGWASSPLIPNPMVSVISNYNTTPLSNGGADASMGMVPKPTASTELLAKNQVLARDLDPEEQVLVRNPVHLQYLPENNGFSTFSRKTFYLLKQLGLESIMAYKVGQSDKEEDPALVNLDDVFDDEYSNPFSELVGQCMDLLEVVALSAMTCTVVSLTGVPLGSTGIYLPSVSLSTDYSSGAMILTRGEHIRNYRQAMRSAMRFRGDNLSMFALYELFHHLPCSISDNSALSCSPAMIQRRLAWRHYIESGQLGNGQKHKQLVFDDQHRIIGGLTLNSGIEFRNVSFLYPQLHHTGDDAEKRTRVQRGGADGPTKAAAAKPSAGEHPLESEEGEEPFSPATRTVSSLTFDSEGGMRIKPALFHANITFPSRGMTAVIGRTGAGKSTLFHLLKRVYNPIPVVVLEQLRALNPTLWSREGLREILEVHTVTNLIPLPPSSSSAAAALPASSCTAPGDNAALHVASPSSTHAFSLEQPGLVTFDGIPAACFSVSYQRQWLVQMEQSPSLLTKKTFQENIRFVYDTVRKSDIEKAAVASRSMEFIEREPLKLLQPVNSLSGGEQQRLGLARTLAVSYAQSRRYRLMHSYADHEASKQALQERLAKERQEAEEAQQKRVREEEEQAARELRLQKMKEEEAKQQEQTESENPAEATRVEGVAGTSGAAAPTTSSTGGPVLAFISAAEEDDAMAIPPIVAPSNPFTLLNENGEEIELPTTKTDVAATISFEPSSSLPTEDMETQRGRGGGRGRGRGGRRGEREREREGLPRHPTASGPLPPPSSSSASLPPPSSNSFTGAEYSIGSTTTTVVGLLLDEPTSRLDVHNEMKVERAINDLIRRSHPAASLPSAQEAAKSKGEGNNEMKVETAGDDADEAAVTEESKKELDDGEGNEQDEKKKQEERKDTSPARTATAVNDTNKEEEEEGAAMVIMIAHRLSTIQAASHVVVISDGQVESQGPPRHVFETSPFAKRQMELQFVAAQQAGAGINIDDLDIPEDPGQRGQGGRGGGSGGRGGRFPGGGAMFRMGGRGRGGGGGHRRR